MLSKQPLSHHTAFLLLSFFVGGTALGADLRIGIIGCDTSHVVAFTETLNDTNSKGHVLGGRVVAAFRGGSPDIPESRNRLDTYARAIREKYDVKFFESIEELCRNVDAVMLESVDGRPHLAQVKPVLAAHKPVYIDKPMAGSLHDAIEIFRLAKDANVPVFSSSALRFSKDTQALQHGSLGRVKEVETYGPCEVEPHHPDLFWYGIHGVEALYAVLGTGCQTVQRGTTVEGKIEVTGTWSDGRKGIFRQDNSFHGAAKGEKGEAPAGTFDGYVPLLEQIMNFFQTGVAPVSPEETTEIITFMEAADESKRQGGVAVKLSDVLRKATAGEGR